MRSISTIVALGMLAAGPAHAEVTAQSPNGFAVSHTVSVAVDPEAAFAMLRIPAKWWDKDHSWTGNSDNLYMDAQAGGCFCELIPNQATMESGAPQRTLRGSVQHMQIIYVDPGRLLRLSGALGPLQGEAVNGTLTISLAPIKGGTRLNFEYVVGGFMRMATGDIALAVDGVIGAQASRFAMAVGPLVGGAGKTEGASGGTAPTAGGRTVPVAVEGKGEPANKARVADLVADLDPDDGVSGGAVASPPGGTAEKPETETSAQPATPRRFKPGTRPLTRPARDREADEAGR